MRKILFSLTLLLACLPAQAHNTKPTDVIGIYNVVYKSDGALIESERVYTKPWSQVKIDRATVQKIDKVIAKYRSGDPPDELFRIAYLTVVDNEIQRVLLLTDLGTAIAIELSSGRYCQTSIAGNGLMGAHCSDD